MASDDDTGSVVSLAERREQLAKAKAEQERRERLETMSVAEVVQENVQPLVDAVARLNDTVAFRDEEVERVAREAARKEADKQRIMRGLRDAERRIRDRQRLSPPTTPPSGPQYPGQWQPVEAKAPENKPTFLFWCGVVGAMALGTYGVCKGIGYVMARNEEREQERKQLRAYKRAMLEAESNPTVHNTYVQHGLGKAEVQDIVIDSLREHGLSRAEARAIAEQGLVNVVDAKVAVAADDLRRSLDNRFSRAQDRTAQSIVDTVNEVASQLRPTEHHHYAPPVEPAAYDDAPIMDRMRGFQNGLADVSRQLADLQRRPDRVRERVMVPGPAVDQEAREQLEKQQRQLGKLSRELAKAKARKPTVVKKTEHHHHEHHNHEHHNHYTATLAKAPRQSKAKPKKKAPLFDTDIG